MNAAHARLADVVDSLDAAYDPRWADPWDAVGLVCGDPAQPVRRVLLAVDPVRAVADEAVEVGADLLVTHHPLLLQPVHGVAATTPKGAVVHRLIGAGVALQVCHTNADSATPGVSDALAMALGLDDLHPLEPDPAPELDKIVTFVPHADAAALIDALAAAGAGSVGSYERCAWTTSGLGTFRPVEGAAPAVGTVGSVEEVGETRIEMVLPRPRRGAVVAALRAAHPYEEPAYDVLQLAAVASNRGTGRLGVLPRTLDLRAFAGQAAHALPATAGGLRVAGDPDQPVRTVAVCGGSGDALLDLVRSSGADVYVTSDLRHHRASEFREYGDGGGPALVDVSHWAAEWTWLPPAATRLASDMTARGTTVDTVVSRICTDPWRFAVTRPSEESRP